jgi:hypothetical protein
VVLAARSAPPIRPPPTLVSPQRGQPASGQRYEGRTGPSIGLCETGSQVSSQLSDGPLVGSLTSDTTSGTRSMLAFRSVVSVLVRFVVRSFSTNSRPALRAAACGGRPRAGSTATGTGAPASPSTSGATKPRRRTTSLPRLLETLRRTAEPLLGFALVLGPARLVLVVELVLFRPTTTRPPNPRECASDPVQHGGLPSCVHRTQLSYLLSA